MSTHNIPFLNIKKEFHPKSSQICNNGIFCQDTQEGVRNSHGKRAISVRATEVLLYITKLFSIIYKEWIHSIFFLLFSMGNNLCDFL